MYSKNAAALSYEFGPVGSSTALQEEIAKLVASKLAEDDGVSLEEIGYLGSTVLCDRSASKITVKLVFHPKLVTEAVPSQFGGAVNYRLSPILNRLSNYMFVGEASSPYVVKFEECTVPKHHLDTRRTTTIDSNGTAKLVDRKIVVFDYNKLGKVTDKTVTMSCVVITCNPDISFASLVDTSLQDEHFRFEASPVKRQAKSERRFAGDNAGMVPAHIRITRSNSDEFHYDANDAIPYLKEKAQVRKNSERSAKELQKQARRDVEDRPKDVKSAKNKRNKSVDKYRRFMNM